MAARAKAAKVKPPRRYLYAAVLRDGRIMRDGDGALVVGQEAPDVRDAANDEADAGNFRVLRYVLESSVRPGGQP